MWRRWAAGVVVALAAAGLLTALPSSGQAAAAGSGGAPNPIRHVVVLLEENHSFDNVLGKFCTEVASGAITRPGTDSHCRGVTWGTTSTGRVTLRSAPDLVPAVLHDVTTQQSDINGGLMNGFNNQAPCTTNLTDCYNQYDPLSGPCAAGSCIPNLSALATDYTVSDATFELNQSPSWEGHMYLVTANQDGFAGFNPKNLADGPKAASLGAGWGCDSGYSTPWIDSTGQEVLVPSCIPDSSGSLGPNWAGYTGPTAPYIPTIFDELDANSLSWKIYGGTAVPGTRPGFESSGWQWAICPSFAECLYGPQAANLVPETNVLTDAADGQLPSFSIITPTAADSQHNGYSMSEGDNYIGQIISAIQSGPDWSSTAVFITYDDCGCFSDHINPLQYNSTWGIRVPMVIVSPYAKAGYTDPKPTTFAGILAFTESTFGLPALNATDAAAYDYRGSFCFDGAVTGCQAAGLGAVPMTSQHVPKPTAAERRAQRIEAEQDT